MWPHPLLLLLLLLLCHVAALTLAVVVSSRRESLLSTCRWWPRRWWWRNIWRKLLLVERLPRTLILLVLVLREVLLRWWRRRRLTVFTASKGAWIIVASEVQRWLWTLLAEGVGPRRGSLLIVPSWLRCSIRRKAHLYLLRWWRYWYLILACKIGRRVVCGRRNRRLAPRRRFGA